MTRKFHIRIVNGWCGNRTVIVRDYLERLLEARGYQVKLDNQSVWENSSPPRHVDLVFQLIPAFQPDELTCPSISIRPLLKDLDHSETLENVFDLLASTYPAPVQT